MEERTVGLLLVMVIIVGFVAYLIVTAPPPEEEIHGVWKYEEGTKELQKSANTTLLLKTVVVEGEDF